MGGHMGRGINRLSDGIDYALFTCCCLTSLTQLPVSCHSRPSSTWSLAGWGTHSQVPGTAAASLAPWHLSSLCVSSFLWASASASASLSVGQERSRQGEESWCQLPNLVPLPCILLLTPVFLHPPIPPFLSPSIPPLSSNSPFSSHSLLVSAAHTPGMGTPQCHSSRAVTQENAGRSSQTVF